MWLVCDKCGIIRISNDRIGARDFIVLQQSLDSLTCFGQYRRKEMHQHETEAQAVGEGN